MRPAAPERADEPRRKRGHVTGTDDNQQPLNGARLRSEFGGQDRKAASERGPLMRFQAGLLGHGEERARQSGALEPRQEDIAALTEHATAMARDAHRPAYDPERNPNDRLREQAFLRSLERRNTLSEAAENAEMALRDAEAGRARVPLPGGEPQVPVVLAVGAVLVLSLTIASTLRDFLFHSIEDDVVAWGLAAFMSLGFGLFLAYGALGGQDGDGQEERGGAVVVGGIVVAVAMGVWRASGGGRMEDYFTAAALTGLEVGVIVILEWAGQRHEAALRKWRARQDARSVAEAAVAAADADLERRAAELDGVEDAVREHVEYVEDRTFRNLAIEELGKAATTAVIDGYNAGISANRGRVRGVRR